VTIKPGLSPRTLKNQAVFDGNEAGISVAKPVAVHRRLAQLERRKTMIFEELEKGSRDG
jgi:hypothetical protein